MSVNILLNALALGLLWGVMAIGVHLTFRILNYADLTAEGSFRLLDMKTDFSLTTTVDMQMLFLSMFFAQNFSNSRGIGMPATIPVSVTDYRGY